MGYFANMSPCVMQQILTWSVLCKLYIVTTGKSMHKALEEIGKDPVYPYCLAPNFKAITNLSSQCFIILDLFLIFLPDLLVRDCGFIYNSLGFSPRLFCRWFWRGEKNVAQELLESTQIPLGLMPSSKFKLKTQPTGHLEGKTRSKGAQCWCQPQVDPRDIEDVLVYKCGLN